MRFLLAIISLIVFINPTCQSQEELVFSLEEWPKFENGDFINFTIWAYENITYPQSAIEDSISGLVFASFFVDSTGTVQDVEIIRGVREDLDKAVIKTIRSSPSWTPGKQRGKNTRVKMVIRMKFELNDIDFTNKLLEFRKKQEKLPLTCGIINSLCHAFCSALAEDNLTKNISGLWARGALALFN